MVVKFSKNNSNYSKDNIIQVLYQASQVDNNIYNFIVSNNYILKVEGDIHRSQWTSDNTQNNYWLKIKVFDLNMNPQPGYTALHIYVCFQTLYYDYVSNNFLQGNCINPPPKDGTDIADISLTTGYWSFVNISYGVSPKTYFFNSNNINIKNPPPKPKSKRLDIIDSKTGKKIKIL